jgi:GTPase SAR1 family protein
MLTILGNKHLALLVARMFLEVLYFSRYEHLTQEVPAMWFRIEKERVSQGGNFELEYKVVSNGVEEIITTPVKTLTEAKKQAETIADARFCDVSVYGKDPNGRFKVGLASSVDDAASADSSPEVQELYRKSVDSSLAIRDRLMLDFDEQMIAGMAKFFTTMYSFAKDWKSATREKSYKIPYKILQKTFMNTNEFNYYNIEGQPAVLALVAMALQEQHDFKPLEGLVGLGSQKESCLHNNRKPEPVVIQLGTDLKTMTVPTVMQGSLPGKPDVQIVVILESGEHWKEHNILKSLAVLYLKKDENDAITWLHKLIKTTDPFKNQLVLATRRGPIVVKPGGRVWGDLVLPNQLLTELKLISNSVEQRDLLLSKGLRIKRGILVSGPPGCGKSSSLEALVHELYGKCSIILVESVNDIRALYDFAKTIAPTIILLEDLDLITTNREDQYSASDREDATGELLGVLSGATEYEDIITVATTNYPEKIDKALSKRAGRFDVHLKLPAPTRDQKLEILHVHMRRLEIPDTVKPEIEQIFTKNLLDLPVVGAHIEEFIKAGVKRGLLKGEVTSFDFQPGIEAIRSIVEKPVAKLAGV